MLVFDLYLHLGELARARALIEQALAREHLDQVHQQWVKIAIRRVWLLLAEGDLEGAQAQIAEIDARGEIGVEEDRVRFEHVRAEVQFARGDAAAALATLAPFEGAPTIECWALMLALRLRAQEPASPGLEADVARARTQLQDPRLPALESLLLRRALVEALVRRHLPAETERDAALSLRQRLADSLGEDPARRDQFFAHFALPNRRRG